MGMLNNNRDGEGEYDPLRDIASLPARTVKYLRYALKWALVALPVGVLGGLIGTAFHYAVDLATEFRTSHGLMMALLPLAGLAIALMYKAARIPLDTNRVIRAVHRQEDVPLVMMPLIFVGTVLTHLFGGSAGREGAALQIGGALGYNLGKLVRLDERDMHLVVACGMAAVFSALFGLPVTAAMFSLEVASVGVIYHAGLIPCLISSFAAKALAFALGARGVALGGCTIPAMGAGALAVTALIALLCAVLSIFFCIALRGTETLAARYIPNSLIRPVVGGAAVAALTFALGTHDYNGAGMDIIASAIGGQAKPEAFALKMLFTVLTVSFGFKGGEIVPTMFIGATLGCALGGALGFDAGFCAAVGLLSLLCAMLNCPLAVIVMGVELFGGEGLAYYAAACALSYTFSGTYGLYGEQNLIYSKLRAMYINIHTK